MDIKLTNGKTTFTGSDFILTSDYLESVGQRIYIRLKSTFGKWFLDTEYGVDWFGKIFGKVKNKNRIDLILKSTIKKEPLVEDITYFKSEIDPMTRVYSCVFKAKIVNLVNEVEYKIITTNNGFAILTNDKKYILTP